MGHAVPNNKVQISVGSVTRWLSLMALGTVAVLLALGLLGMPWLGFNVRSAIQQHMLDARISARSLDLSAKITRFPSKDASSRPNGSDSLMAGRDRLSKMNRLNHSHSVDGNGTEIKAATKQSRAVSSIDGSGTNRSQTQTPTEKHPVPVPVPVASPPPPPLLDDVVLRNQTTAGAPHDKQRLGQCDLFHGKWVHDTIGPLYKNDSCPLLTQAQNCQGNGRPDKDYENWRWQPSGCDLPRFDARSFLEVMRGKVLAYVGDSVARNQMESMMCMLWQFEVPKNKGNRKMQRWYFSSHDVTIIRVWSSWLVHHSDEAFQFAPAGITKLYLDRADEFFMELIPKFDVMVISTGHWFVKKSVFIYKDNIVGGQLWWEQGHEKTMDNVEAFTVAMNTALKAIATYPNYKGLTILRTYSPDHYEGGTWNTGGSCTGKTSPYTDANLVTNGFTDMMLSRQLKPFEEARKEVKNGSKMLLLNITSIFHYRADGHPGPYRSPDPNKITKRGPDGRPPPQDCLHWCMPGPVDTWNELLSEIVARNLNNQ